MDSIVFPELPTYVGAPDGRRPAARRRPPWIPAFPADPLKRNLAE
ncbi:hypothetical protein ACIA5D_50560 [Actinoplanes sp. NPDC051513]